MSDHKPASSDEKEHHSVRPIARRSMDEEKVIAKAFHFHHKTDSGWVISAHSHSLTDNQGRIIMVAEMFEELSIMDRDTSLCRISILWLIVDSLTHLPNRKVILATLRMRFSEFQ